MLKCLQVTGLEVELEELGGGAGRRKILRKAGRGKSVRKNSRVPPSDNQMEDPEPLYPLNGCAIRLSPISFSLLTTS